MKKYKEHYGKIAPSLDEAWAYFKGHSNTMKKIVM